MAVLYFRTEYNSVAHFKVLLIKQAFSDTTETSVLVTVVVTSPLLLPILNNVDDLEQHSFPQSLNAIYQTVQHFCCFYYFTALLGVFSPFKA
jgi:hypothetical protein